MTAVYKYPFPIIDHFTLSLPLGAEILHVDDQRGQACLWALVATERKTEVRRFRIIGTGNPIEGGADDLTHIGTFAQGPFVWHVFEEN